MRLFHAKLLDQHLEDPNGAGVVAYASTAWACLLPRAETLKFTCIIDRITGSPTFTLNLNGCTSDWNLQENLKASSTAGVSSSTTINVTYSPADAKFPPPRHLIVQAVLTGSGTKAHVVVWVCGRGPQLLEPIPPVGASFGAQLAAAKMFQDEDRLPLQKSVLRQGASLFYPPELLLASEKWER